jgi:hypothetical protein
VIASLMTLLAASLPRESLARHAETDLPPIPPGVLVAVRVLDASDGQPVKSFRVIPGTPFMLIKGPDDPSPAVWQGHLLREAKNGIFEWSAERSYRQFRLRFEAEG